MSRSSPKAETDVTSGGRFITRLPSAALRDYVSHYWLSRNNRDATHCVLPDGAVDLVIQVRSGFADSLVYGTTTIRHDVGLDRGTHYLGVSFRPGQSRHFMRTAALELTDTHEPAREVLRLDLSDLAEMVGANSVFARFDEILSIFLNRHPPERTRIDAAITLFEASCGMAPISEAAAQFARSSRQFERVFLETVGVSAKRFSQIMRFRRAAALAVHSPLSLAAIAAGCGYCDQSHMSHELKPSALRDEPWGDRHFVVVDPNGIGVDIVQRNQAQDSV